MDRALLEGDPHAVLEGILIGGYAIGASESYIYIRAEYPLAIQRLKVALQEMEERGLLGDLRAGMVHRIRDQDRPVVQKVPISES